MSKIMVVLGNRPQLVKYDPILGGDVVYTGQHYSSNLSKVFMKEFGIKPVENLHKTELGEMVDGLIKIAKKRKPGYIMVYGDTRSTLAGGMAALYLNIPLIHVESGNRSFDNTMVEERIRKVIDRQAVINFAPCERAARTLENEGCRGIYNVGATNLDKLENAEIWSGGTREDYCVVTVHRPSNIIPRQLKMIFSVLGKCGKKIKFFAHPATQEVIVENGIIVKGNIKILPPISYEDMVNEMASAEKVITDSGGMQIEAMYLGIPCVTLRDSTEWPETISLGWNELATKGFDILRAINSPHERIYLKHVYGDGTANLKIKEVLDKL